MRLHNEKVMKSVFAILGATSEGVAIVLQCLDVMLTKRRKQVSQQRALAFIKRLCTLALHVLPNASIGILATNRILMHVSSDTDVNSGPAAVVLCLRHVLIRRLGKYIELQKESISSLVIPSRGSHFYCLVGIFPANV